MTYLGKQIKELTPKAHGKRGYRVVSTGKDYPTRSEAKAAIAALVFPYTSSTFDHVKRTA